MNKAMANPKQDITTVVRAPIDSNPAAAFVAEGVDVPVLVAEVVSVAVLLIVELEVPLTEAIGLDVGTGEPLDSDVLAVFVEPLELCAPAALLMSDPPSMPMLW